VTLPVDLRGFGRELREIAHYVRKAGRMSRARWFVALPFITGAVAVSGCGGHHSTTGAMQPGVSDYATASTGGLIGGVPTVKTTIEVQDGLIFGPATRGAPKLTAQQAFDRAERHMRIRPPKNGAFPPGVQARIGILTRGATGKPELAFALIAAPSACATTNPSGSSAGRCVHWDFLSTQTGMLLASGNQQL
jgi:hypothetical protein